MKKSVNRNVLASQLLLRQLELCGIKFANISPGSRSTPLIFALHESEITKNVFIDERSSAYAALGMAKSTGIPPIIITTSGTAVANLYPAIVEAYMDRVPLIVITADRPERLYNSGANQTINQQGIFSNHIRKSYHFEVTEPVDSSLQELSSIAQDSWLTSTKTDPGPVHINISFDKPFEPDSFTDEVDFNIAELLKKVNNRIQPDNYTIPNKVSSKLNHGNTIIYAGGIIDITAERSIVKLSETFGLPLLVDGTSPLRHRANISGNQINTFPLFLKKPGIIDELPVNNVIYFGTAPTGSAMQKWFEKISPFIIQITPFGESKDPSLSPGIIERTEAEIFCNNIISANNTKPANSILAKWQEIEQKTIASTKCYLEQAKWNFEGKLINTIYNHLPDYLDIVIGNSMPARDVDLYTAGKECNLHFNRGASGIDGLIATTSGICIGTKKPVALILGDVSFLYDSNSMLYIKQLNLPILICVINNNGGKIFNMLPVSKYSELLTPYFHTPPNISIEQLCKPYTDNFKKINAQNDLEKSLTEWNDNPGFCVLEIDTSDIDSTAIRKNFRISF